MLTKLPKTTFFPGVAGQSYEPARSWCIPAPTAPGTWEYSCETIRLPENGGISLPPGSTIYYDENNVGYAQVCSSKWVPGNGTVGAPTCYSTPEQPFIQAVPSRYDIVNDFGWNAGGNSIIELDDELHLGFTMDAAVGLGIGFVTDLDNIGTLDRILYGFYFHMTTNGASIFNVLEDGKIIGEPTEYQLGDAFDLQRYVGAVSFWHNGVMIRQSRKASTGPLSVGSAIYASGDTI